MEIKKTSGTPHFKIDSDSGVMTMIGRAVSETSENFFNQVRNILNEYTKTHKINQIVFDLEYINTKSTRHLMGILKELQGKNNQTKIIWHCEDDDADMIELAHDFKSVLILDVTIDMIPV